MSTRQSQFPTGRLDMARMLNGSIEDISDSLLTFSGRKYYITLGLRSMKWDEWIGESFFDSNIPTSPLTSYIPNAELDNHYLKYHADKARRIEERGTKCCYTAPEPMDAAIELLEEL